MHLSGKDCCCFFFYKYECQLKQVYIKLIIVPQPTRYHITMTFLSTPYLCIKTRHVKHLAAFTCYTCDYYRWLQSRQCMIDDECSLPHGQQLHDELKPGRSLSL